MPWRFFLRVTACLLAPAAAAFSQPTFPQLSATRHDSALLTKAFPLLSLLESQPVLRQTLRSDKTLHQVAYRQARRSYRVLRPGPAAARHYADSLIWQPREIRAIGNSLVVQYTTNPQVRQAVAPLLGNEGGYPLYAGLPDTSALRRAWQDAAQGLNRMVRVYMANEVPRYPAVDSSVFRRQDAAYAQRLRNALLPMSRKARRAKSFYTLPMRAALLALRLNRRDEATRYEPLTAGLNRAPAAAVAHTPWERYAFSVILVPGLGPETPGVALDSLGAYRCRLAAARYRQGLAPFLVVSGGHVHPNQTPYCEAVEMKKYLVETLGVPDAAVLIEPYARHTTTNVRNTARLLYTLGIPTDRPLLTVTDTSQSRYLLSMEERCRRELGYVPYRGMQRRSDVENSCFPVPEARQPDPYDPLDP